MKIKKMKSTNNEGREKNYWKTKRSTKFPILNGRLLLANFYLKIQNRKAIKMWHSLFKSKFFYVILYITMAQRSLMFKGWFLEFQWWKWDTYSKLKHIFYFLLWHSIQYGSVKMLYLLLGNSEFSSPHRVAGRKRESTFFLSSLIFQRMVKQLKSNVKKI